MFRSCFHPLFDIWDVSHPPNQIGDVWYFGHIRGILRAEEEEKLDVCPGQRIPNQKLSSPPNQPVKNLINPSIL